LGWLTGPNSATGRKGLSVSLANQPGPEAEAGRSRAERSRKASDGRPPPQKRSPALAGNKRRAISQLQQRTSTRSGRTCQRFRSASLTVYDGIEIAGYLEEIDNRFAAFTVDGQSLGTFSTLVAAARAIPAAHGGVHA